MSELNDAARDLIIGAATDAGMTGKNNEDAFALFQVDWEQKSGVQRLHVATVCDGIGGNNAGEIASKVAIETIRGIMAAETMLSPAARMERAVQAANQQVYETARDNPVLRGMGTTVVMATIAGDDLRIVHAGDSRAYLVRNGQAQRLTLDHTWAQEAMDHGVLTPEAARVHPNRNVIRRFLGIEENVVVDHAIIDPARPPSDTEGSNRWPTLDSMALQPGDTILLCSDGLTDEISDEELQTAVRRYAPQEAADRLVALANDHGGRDNITVAVMRLPGTPQAAPVAADAPRSRPRLAAIAGAVAALTILAILAGALLLSRDGVSTPPVSPPTVSVEPSTGAPSLAIVTDTPSPTAQIIDTPTSTPAAAAVTAAAPASPMTVTQIISSATGAVTVTVVVSPSIGEVDGAATSTPIPTHTPTRTATPILRLPSPTATGTPTAAASPSADVTVDLLLPVNGVSSSGVLDFQWRLTSGALTTDQAFELRFWKPGEDPLLDGFSPTGATGAQVQRVSLPATDANSGVSFAPGDYLWGIVLVAGPSNTPVALISPVWRFTYESSPDGGSQGCVGAGCGRP